MQKIMIILFGTVITILGIILMNIGIFSSIHNILLFQTIGGAIMTLSGMLILGWKSQSFVKAFFITTGFLFVISGIFFIVISIFSLSADKVTIFCLSIIAGIMAIELGVFILSNITSI